MAALSDEKARQVEELVIASQQGDSHPAKRGASEAFGKLYDIFVQPIYRYIYYRAGKSDAEDLTELVFLKTWEHIKKYHKGTSSFSSWIFRIAHNVVIDHYRNARPEQELSEEMPDTRKESHTQTCARRNLTNEILASAISHLKEQYKQVIILKYINELSNEEIGHIMGKSQAALRILQFRALRMLRNLLEEKGISDYDP